ncbi:MAG: helix-turn-helix domain-containing protein [Rhodobacteraceae bacterium]|nr:helix-turn-helix domain-containing protein [Paracoccaceae bacterium]
MPQNRDISTTFAKGLAVLGCFDGRAADLGLAEIARRTGHDRATVRRLVLTLCAEGYLRQTGRTFCLRPKVLALAGGMLQAGGFGRTVQPLLDRHARQLGHPITLAVRDDLRVLLVAQSTIAGAPVSFGFTLGSALPLLHTSLGRVLLAQAHTPADLIARAPRTPHTDQSLTDPAALAAAVTLTRDRGYALVDGEFEPGTVGIAVPLGRVAALGASVPRGTGSAEGFASLICPALQTCAAELAQGMDLARLT